jgi:predicted transposase YdaD
MNLTEWNTVEYGQVQREEGEKEGIKKGREEGREEVRDMVLDLLDQGYTPEQIRARLAGGRTPAAKATGKNEFK